jgi:serine/threonine protein kinase
MASNSPVAIPTRIYLGSVDTRPPIQTVAVESSSAGTVSSHGELRKADLAKTDLSGLQLAQYELGKRIGSGGMGLVYEARHRHLGKKFAVKFIAQAACDHPEVAARFLHEVQAVGSLDHPHLIVAVDAGTAHGLQYCVTEFLEGRDLAAWVNERGPMPVGAACEVIRQASLGLAHAHARGFVHRDVKPGNIFLDSGARVKVLDFGIASSQANQSSLTLHGQFMGSVDFIAPEQASDARQATSASDVYSLGCTLIFLLSGQPPYPDKTHPDFVSKLTGVATESPAWLGCASDSVPAELLCLLSRLVEKSPCERIDSAAEVAQRLSQLADQRQLSDWLDGVPVTTHSPLCSAIAPSRTWKAKPLGLICGVALLVSATAGIALWLGGSPAKPDRFVPQTDSPLSDPDLTVPDINAPEPNVPEPNVHSAASVAPPSIPQSPATQSIVQTPGSARNANGFRRPAKSKNSITTSPSPEPSSTEDKPSVANQIP